MLTSLHLGKGRQRVLEEDVRCCCLHYKYCQRSKLLHLACGPQRQVNHSELQDHKFWRVKKQNYEWWPDQQITFQKMCLDAMGRELLNPHLSLSPCKNTWVSVNPIAFCHEYKERWVRQVQYVRISMGGHWTCKGETDFSGHQLVAPIFSVV